MNINSKNIENIRSQIIQKKGFKPYFANVDTTSAVLTDYDNFPYNRWWRGIPEHYEPIVAEREAGWRRINNDCYRPKKDYTPDNNRGNIYCWQPAASTVYPCKPNVPNTNMLNSERCIVEYR